MDDLEILNEENLSERVYMVFEKYKPYIYKKAINISKISKGFVDVEDFVSDTYEWLYYFIDRIKKEKTNENFSYYIHVKFAVLRVINKNVKISKNERFLEDYEDFACPEERESDFKYDLDKFVDTLPKRQKIVFVKKLNGETFETIEKFLNVSHGTAVRDNQLATKSFANYFGYVI